MANFNGSIVINGIDDRELVKILEIKIKHEKSLNFNPQQLQPVPAQPPRPYPQPQPQPVIQPQQYNNAVFTWQTDEGLEAVHQVISMLLKKEERQEKSAA
jgi:hypothetical protein